MLHTIMISENELKDLIASHFPNATRDMVGFGLKEGQMGETIVSATISYADEQVLLTSRNTQCS